MSELNSSNYQVNIYEGGEYIGHYYLQCGWSSLWRFSKSTNVSFRALCKALLADGSLEIGTDLEICMI